ncbi:MAG: LptA/OstA family protein, partial [Gammaproteobacteria bacterium]|nr:LptA/OstA family protein [Gammaproteobacteria bacterium]
MAVLLLCLPCLVWAKSKSVTPGTSASGSPPLDVTANRIDYRQDQDVYEADGSVVIQQGAMRLTADHVTIEALSGVVHASGHVHLTDPQADVTTERMDFNVNTEAGVITHGQLYV